MTTKVYSKGIFVKCLAFIPYLIIFFSLNSFAASKKNMNSSSKVYGEQVAKSTSILLKDSKTIKSFINKLNGYYSSKDLKRVRKKLLINDISMKSKLPAHTLKGSKIIFDRNNYIDFISPEILIFNGIKLKKTKHDFSKNLNLVLLRLKQKQNLSWFEKLFFSKAYAMNTMQGLIAAVAAGSVGAVSGERFFGWNRWTGGALGVGAVYLLTELIQSRRNGEVSCSLQGQYRIRNKSRNGLLMATADYEVVPEATLTAAGLPTRCTSSRAAELSGSLGRDVESPTSTDSSSGSLL